MDLIKQIISLFSTIDSILDNDTKLNLKNTNHNAIYNNNFGLYIWISQNILKENSTIISLFNKSGITKKEDMCNFVIHLYHLYLNDKL